jgi:hypothetical protein
LYASQIGNYSSTSATLNEVINQTVTDADGNVYIIGNFVGTVDFDPGPGVSSLVNLNTSTTDVFFAKYSAAGNLLFCQRIGANGNDVGLGIAVDQNRNIIITGGFTVTVDFDPGPGTANLANTSTTIQDFFLAKYDANGNYLWAYKMGNAGTLDQGRNVAVDATGNIYCSGLFTNTVDMDFGAGTANLVSGPSISDIFVAKYNTDGAYQYAFSISGPSTKSPDALVVDADGQVYVGGWFISAIDVDPSAASVSLSSGSTSAADIFFAKYSASGAYLMAKRLGSSTVSQSETLNAMSLASNGDIIITGEFRRTMDFDPGAGTVNLNINSGAAMYVARYTNNGDYVFAKMIGSETNTTTGTTLGLDATGNIIAAGTFNGKVDLDPGEGIEEVTPTVGGTNVLLVKLDAQGTYLGGGRIGGTGPMQAVSRRLHADDQGNVTIAGVFSQLGDFDPTGGILTRSASNGNDIFLANFTTASAPSHYTTAKAGAWNDPATWIGGQVPPSGAAVKLLHVVSVSGNITVKSLEANPGGGVNLAAGANLVVQQ